VIFYAEVHANYVSSQLRKGKSRIFVKIKEWKMPFSKRELKKLISALHKDPAKKEKEDKQSFINIKRIAEKIIDNNKKNNC